MHRPEWHVQSITRSGGSFVERFTPALREL